MSRLRRIFGSSIDTAVAPLHKPVPTKRSKFVVSQTYFRASLDEPPTARDRILLEAGLGLRGDCHASQGSSRQVLLVATGSYARLRLEENSLRENILVDADVLGWRSGYEVAIGYSAKLRIMFRCDPCLRLNRFRDGLSRDAFGDRGLLARVVKSGVVRVGDAVRVTPDVYPSVSEDWRLRLSAIVESLPARSWTSYQHLAVLVGVHKSYCRAFPRLLRRYSNVRLTDGRVEKLGRGTATCRMLSLDWSPFSAAERHERRVKHQRAADTIKHVHDHSAGTVI